MIIGIDIDDTITETREKTKEYLAYYKPGFQDYHKLPEDEYRTFLELNIIKIMANVRLKNGVKEAFKYFNDQGFKIYIITARGNKYDSRVKEVTKEFLQKNELIYENIFFSEKKGKLAKDLGINLFIDDKVEVLDDIRANDIDCLHFTKDGSKYKSFANWFDIINYFESRDFGGKNN